MLKKIVALIIVLGFLLSGDSIAQTIRLRGRVMEENSGEAIPFVNISIKGSTKGTTADSSGNFALSMMAGRKRDTLLFSAMGFELKKLPVFVLADQYLTIELKPNAVNLKEAVIRPGENPAHRILRKVIANKERNNPELLDAYEYEVYHKVEFDMNHFTEKIKRNIFLRSFGFVFNNADTTSDGVNYLPVLLTESNSHFFYRKDPKVSKELVKGRRSVGLKGPKIMKFAEDMYLSPDIYKDYILILDKNFPSPIQTNFLSNYRYYLIDSVLFKGRNCYYIQFKPKQKESVAFTGEMYIDDSTFAVSQIDLSFSIAANVNFVRNYWIRQEYSFLGGKQTFLTRSKVIGDFTVAENSKEMTGFYGKKTSEYRNHRINIPKEKEFYIQLDKITFEDSALNRTEQFWASVRSDSLTKQEKSVVVMIDTLEQQSKFRLLKNSIKSITSGWIPFGAIELGDFYTFYSYNSIEKSRLKLGLRAKHLFDDRLYLKSYLAYGTNDSRWKYLAEGQFVISRSRSKESRVGGRVKNDLLQPGRSSTLFSLDHVFNSFTNLGSFRYRSLVDEKNFYLERQWLTGFTTRAELFASRWQACGAYSFIRKPAENISFIVPSYAYSGFKIALRFAVGERSLSADFADGFRARSLSNKPVVSLLYEKGLDGFLGGDFNADKLKLRIETKIHVSKFGYTLMRLEAGKVWGVLPFQFLETPLANPILFADETAFNLMNYYEFIGDQYFSAMWEHHLEGLLLNRIPYLNKLKWRELLLAKVYWSSLSKANARSQYVLPNDISIMDQPYVEVGFGIENILKFSRVDFLWRLSYLDNQGAYRFIAKPMFQFKF